MTGARKKNKVSLSIIGDAFADLFCFMTDGLPPAGGDVRVKHPMTPVPGGSGINTATHLASLVKNFSNVQTGDQEEDLEAGVDDLMDVTLQTAINEHDYYGSMLIHHAKQSGFQIINCHKHRTLDNPSTKEIKKQEEKGDEKLEKSQKSSSSSSATSASASASTGHCLVMVYRGERSFMTHLGVIETFKASDTVLHELVHCRSADPSFVNHHHHIHIAGYYNLKMFQDGNLKRRLKLVREKRRANSHDGNIFTTTTSLVPQYDATGKWDGGLVEDVLPLIDFLILNALEAGKISGILIDEKDCGRDLSRTVTLTQVADFFFEKSPLTHVIVTLGSLGAVCLYQGEVVVSMQCPKRYSRPVDPTGAGDAFSAGFLFGVMHWRQSRNHEDFAEIGSLLEGSWTDAIVEGMKFGCCAGTACVATPGASVSASKAEIEELLRMVEEEEYVDDVDVVGEGEEDDDDEDYDEEEDEDYVDEESYDSDESYEDDSEYTDESYSHASSRYSTEADGEENVDEKKDNRISRKG